MKCCTDRHHAWDEFKVAKRWVPSTLRCLIVGENPGSKDSGYFYDERSTSVAVRTIILRELCGKRWIDEPTLPAFRDAGFLFDHGIRCRLPDGDVRNERVLAEHFGSPRCANAVHLRPWIERAQAVWVMGYIARNAVAGIRAELPREVCKISRAPYPRQAPAARRFFISRYVTRAPRSQVTVIFKRLDAFLRDRTELQPAPRSST